ncbi:protein PRY2-like, partial [Anneissia japonica]|uniref:protein PRY2-like n=1 Tax=Anneissia japonica TaxID=1529436 RepID=UPI001425819E
STTDWTNSTTDWLRTHKLTDWITTVAVSVVAGAVAGAVAVAATAAGDVDVSGAVAFVVAVTTISHSGMGLEKNIYFDIHVCLETRTTTQPVTTQITTPVDTTTPKVTTQAGTPNNTTTQPSTTSTQPKTTTVITTQETPSEPTNIICTTAICTCTFPQQTDPYVIWESASLGDSDFSVFKANNITGDHSSHTLEMKYVPLESQVSIYLYILYSLFYAYSYHQD